MLKQHYADFEKYLLGEELYGDDFSSDEISSWYKDEEEAYADMVDETYTYRYHALNKIHGYNKLPNLKNGKALGIGSAFGDEFLPYLDNLESITILDPSEKFTITQIEHVKVNYQKPSISGRIDAEDNTFDLVTVFSALHHIPNVSFVIQEIARVLRPGGCILIREPINSMGDWTKPRPGLTIHERGISPQVMTSAIQSAGLKITSSTPCFFPAVLKVLRLLPIKSDFNSPLTVQVDALFSKIFAWNMSYDRRTKFKKLSPGAVFWVCQKK